MKYNPIEQVAEFHNMFGMPVLQNPVIPSLTRTGLRLSLLTEELREFKEGIENRDIVEIADALADLQYVLSGAILEFGLTNKFEAIFNEVHRSNMSKTCKTREEAELTVKHYKELDGTESYIKEVGEEFLVYRTPDNKALKSINYSKADIKSIIRESQFQSIDIK